MQKYESKKVVGQGSFGKAILCARRADSKLCIIKQISLAKLSSRDAKATELEATLLSKLKHPNIVTFWESFTENSCLHIVMEYADGGDLDHYVKNHIKTSRNKEIPEKQVLHLFVQMSLAIKHIHDRKILHRDLKSQNVFLTSGGLCKVGDFGVSRVLRNTVELASTQIGTPYYMSPEIMNNQKYNSKTDIWSLGCILYELMCLRLPFGGTSMRQLCYNIINAAPPPPPNAYSKELRDLLRDTLLKNPKVRVGINSVLTRPIMRDRISSFLGETKRVVEFNHTVLHGADILTQLPLPLPAANPAADLLRRQQLMLHQQQQQQQQKVLLAQKAAADQQQQQQQKVLLAQKAAADQQQQHKVLLAQKAAADQQQKVLLAQKAAAEQQQQQQQKVLLAQKAAAEQQQRLLLKKKQEELVQQQQALQQQRMKQQQEEVQRMAQLRRQQQQERAKQQQMQEDALLREAQQQRMARAKEKILHEAAVARAGEALFIPAGRNKDKDKEKEKERLCSKAIERLQSRDRDRDRDRNREQRPASQQQQQRPTPRRPSLGANPPTRPHSASPNPNPNHPSPSDGPAFAVEGLRIGLRPSPLQSPSPSPSPRLGQGPAQEKRVKAANEAILKAEQVVKMLGNLPRPVRASPHLEAERRAVQRLGQAIDADASSSDDEKGGGQRAAASNQHRPGLLPPRRASDGSAPAPLLMESQWLSKLEARMGQVQQQVRQFKDLKDAKQQQQSPPPAVPSAPSVCSEGSVYGGYAFGQQRPPPPVVKQAGAAGQQQKQQPVQKPSKPVKTRSSGGGGPAKPLGNPKAKAKASKAKAKAKADRESPAVLLEKKKREAADSSKEALLERKESREQHHKNFRAFMLEQKKKKGQGQGLLSENSSPSLSPLVAEGPGPGPGGIGAGAGAADSDSADQDDDYDEDQDDDYDEDEDAAGEEEDDDDDGEAAAAAAEEEAEVGAEVEEHVAPQQGRPAPSESGGKGPAPPPSWEAQREMMRADLEEKRRQLRSPTGRGRGVSFALQVEVLTPRESRAGDAAGQGVPDLGADGLRRSQHLVAAYQEVSSSVSPCPRPAGVGPSSSSSEGWGRSLLRDGTAGGKPAWPSSSSSSLLAQPSVDSQATTPSRRAAGPDMEFFLEHEIADSEALEVDEGGEHGEQQGQQGQQGQEVAAPADDLQLKSSLRNNFFSSGEEPAADPPFPFIPGSETLKSMALEYSVVLAHLQSILLLPNQQAAAGQPDLGADLANLSDDCLFQPAAPAADSALPSAISELDELCMQMEAALLLEPVRRQRDAHADGDEDDEDDGEYEEDLDEFEEEEGEQEQEQQGADDAELRRLDADNTDYDADAVDEEDDEAATAAGRVRATQQLLLRAGAGGDPFHDTTAIPALAVAVSVPVSQEGGLQEEFDLPAPSSQQLRVSALRVKLEARLGQGALLRALDFLENIHEHGRPEGQGQGEGEDDDDFLIDQIESIVGTEQLCYLDDLYTLLALESGEWLGDGDEDGDQKKED